MSDATVRDLSLVLPYLDVQRLVSGGKLDELKAAVRLGLNINDQYPGIKFPMPPLTMAIFMERKEVFDYLLAEGADLSLRDSRSMLPLAWAALNRDQYYYNELAKRIPGPHSPYVGGNKSLIQFGEECCSLG